MVKLLQYMKEIIYHELIRRINRTEEDINCMWLNTEYGKGYWICNGFLKPVNEEICKNCEERKK